MNSRTRNALTFVAGFCDTMTFIHMGGVFSAHVTGNFILFAASLAQGVKPEDYIKIGTFPVFLVAVMIGTFTFHKLQKKDGEGCYKHLLTFMTSLLFVAFLLSFLHNKWIDIVITMTVVTALGIQNTIHHFIPGPMTTVMTGTVMNTTAILTEKYIFHMKQSNKSDGIKSYTLSPLMILCFFSGCVFAAIMTTYFGFKSLVFPVFLMIVFTAFEK